MTETKKMPYGDRKWKEDLYVEVFKLARMGRSNEQISQIIGVTRGVFDRWRRERPAFQKALDDARDLEQKREEVVERLCSRLPPELQDVWDRILACEPEEKDCDKEVIQDKRRLRVKIDKEIDKLELRAKKRLFVFAYYGTDFNRTEASRLTGVGMETVKTWLADKDFSLLMQHMEEAKDDLYESALVQLVKQGEPGAVIFANKTRNRNRGYNDKVDTNVNVHVAHSVEDLGLTLEEKKLLLAKIRERTEILNLEEKIIEVEAR